MFRTSRFIARSLRDGRVEHVQDALATKGFNRPVLKHGPRSVTYVRVFWFSANQEVFNKKMRNEGEKVGRATGALKTSLSGTTGRFGSHTLCEEGW